MNTPSWLTPLRCVKSAEGIVEAGSPVLRHRAVEVDPAELGSPLFRGMVAELLRCLGKGVGVAAPQIGFGVRVIAIEDGPHKWQGTKAPPTEAQLLERGRVELPRSVLVNPEITLLGDRRADVMEGCMSVGDIAAVVARHWSVHLRALDLEGNLIEGDYQGWPARILQHEIDHLDGVLFVDRMEPRTLTRYTSLGELWAGATTTDIRAGLNAVTPGPPSAAPPPTPGPASPR